MAGGVVSRRAMAGFGLAGGARIARDARPGTVRIVDDKARQTGLKPSNPDYSGTPDTIGRIGAGLAGGVAGSRAGKGIGGKVGGVIGGPSGEQVGGVLGGAVGAAVGANLGKLGYELAARSFGAEGLSDEELADLLRDGAEATVADSAGNAAASAGAAAGYRAGQAFSHYNPFAPLVGAAIGAAIGKKVGRILGQAAAEKIADGLFDGADDELKAFETPDGVEVEPDLKGRDLRRAQARASIDGGLSDLEGMGYELPAEILVENPITIADHVRAGVAGGFIGVLPGGLLMNPVAAGVGFAAGFGLGVYATYAQTRGIVGAYNFATDTLYMNDASDFWDDAEEAQRRFHDEGWFSSPDPKHVVYHEVAHRLHFFEGNGMEDYQKNAFAELTRDEAFLVSEEVSQYGATDAGEMVAEVFAAHVAGVEFSPEVYEIYEKYGGPELR